MHKTKTKPMFEFKSLVMKDLNQEIEDYALQKYPCVYFGKTGVGKEFAARIYYDILKRKLNKEIPYIRHNCAGLNTESAISELFGHKKGSFTGAEYDKEGLFKEAKGGILFLDEIGELSGEVQSMLLRAIDPGIQEARPLGGDKNDSYSTAEVLLLTATDKPHKIQKPLLNRLGAQLEIPCLNNREEDVPGAIYFNVIYALDKRIDKFEVINEIFNTNIDIEFDRSRAFTDLEEVKTIAKLVKEKLSLVVLKRNWPGNFRALRIAIDTAIIRAKKFDSPEQFVDDVKKYFVINLDKYSKPLNSSVSKVISASIQNAENSDIYQRINDALPRVETAEKHKISVFLSINESSVFTRSDFEDAIKIKTRTAQNRIKQLVTCGIIAAEGKRNDCFKYIQTEQPKAFTANTLTFLGLPPDLPMLEGRNNEINEVLELIPNVNSLYISGEKGVGKTLFVQTVANKLKTKIPVYYYPIGTKGISNLINIFLEELQKRNIANLNVTYNSDQDIILLIASMSGYMEQLLGKDPNPVFFIDNLSDYNNSLDLKAIAAMLKFWTSLKFILAGNKLDNAELFEGNSIMEYHLK